MTFVVPVPYRKSLSWNTLRARKRAEAKEAASTAGVRVQENGLLRKAKESTTPAPLPSPAAAAKGKVSKTGRRRTLMMSYVCATANLVPPHLAAPATIGFKFWFLTRVCACVGVNLQTHTHSFYYCFVNNFFFAVILNPAYLTVCFVQMKNV